MAAPESPEPGWSLGDVFGRPHDARLVLFLAPVATTLALLGALPLQSWDYWWHLTVGRLVDHWGAVPDANHFLYTLPADAPSFIQPWLADLLLYGAHVNGSVHFALIARNLATASVIGWVGYRAMRRSRSIPLGSLATLAVLPLAIAGSSTGPALFGWLLFAAVLSVALRLRDGEAHHFWLAAFPVGAALWVNLHSGFWMAALLPALFGLGALLRARRGSGGSGPDPLGWGIAAAAALLAWMANPRGLQIYRHLVESGATALSVPAAGSAIAVSPLDPALAGPWLYATLLAVAALVVWRRERIEPTDAVALGAFGLASILDGGGLLWFAVGAPVIAAGALGGLGGSSDRSEPHAVTQRIYTLGALFFVVAAIGLQPTWRWRVDWVADSELFGARDRAPLAGVVPDETPQEPVELLARRVDPPRIFHDRRYAGFLLYHLTGPRPRRKVFVDARAELPPPRVWREYDRVLNDDTAWRSVFDRYEVGAVVLSRRQMELVERLDASESWSILMQEKNFALLVPVDES